MRLNRRAFLKLSSTSLAAKKIWAFPQATAQGQDLEVSSLDREIWAEELEAFVPSKILDVHTHLPCWRFNLDPKKPPAPPDNVGGALFSETTLDLLTRCNRILMPGREMHYLAFPAVFPNCDFDGSNAHVAYEIKSHNRATGLMLVHPGLAVEHIERTLEFGKFLGFKCYRLYSTSGDTLECRITDFMPENQIDIANRHGLIIMLHLAKSKACADPENLADLRRLCSKYPRVRWILAHCARSFTPFPIEKAGRQLRDLPNVWIDTSAVCESASFSLLFETFGSERVVYGSDSPRVGMARGKYVSVGRGWLGVDHDVTHSLNSNVTDLRLTFYAYESLRALRYAAHEARLSRRQIQAIFYDSAYALVESVRRNLA